MDTFVAFISSTGLGHAAKGGYAVVIESRIGEREIEFVGGQKSTTRNIMELTAMIEALRKLPKDARGTINSDNTYAVEGITERRKSLEKRGFAKVKNSDLLKDLFKLVDQHPYVKYKRIKFRNGQAVTERVKQLARNEANKQPDVSAVDLKVSDHQSYATNCVPEMDTFVAYIDGSCLKNPGRGGYAAVIEYKIGEPIQIVGGRRWTTNNRMEMIAMIEALKKLSQDAVGTIHSDSTYVVNGITEWRKGWEERNFANIKNLALWKDIFKLVDEHPNVKYKWIKGHNGHPMNELVDQLAKQEARKQ